MVPVEVQGASIRMPSKPLGMVLAEPLGAVSHRKFRIQRQPREVIA